MKLAAKPFTLAGLVGSGGSGLGGLTYTGVTQLGSGGSSPSLDFSNYEGLKTYLGGECAQYLLDEKERKLMNTAGTEWHQLTNKFVLEGSESASGCALIYWDKELWKDGKWKGTIRYEWIFKRGGESLVFYGLFNSSEDSSKIRWRVTYINGDKAAYKLWDADSPQTRMPQNPTFETTKEENFGFKSDFTKLCSSKECADHPQEKKTGEARWYWLEAYGGGDKFSDWTKNFKEAFDGFITDTNQGDLKNFQQMAEKKGTWQNF